MAAVIVVYVDRAGRVVRVEERDRLTIPQGASDAYGIAKDVIAVAQRRVASLPIASEASRAWLIGKIKASPLLTEAQRAEAVYVARGAQIGTVISYQDATAEMIAVASGGVPPQSAQIVARYVDP